MGFVELSYNSSGISFSEWISLFTLCLAPLLAHVLSGAPSPRCLTKETPKWHERLGHYNPTSILWRYIAIADRRIRALSWSSADMAATNALLWTDNGWDGSESMTFRAIPYATRLPDSGNIQILSGEMLKTVIITLQGAQALYSVISDNIPGKYFGRNAVSLDNLFAPLAILGLFRLPAALFLTEDFNFMLHSGFELHLLPDEPLLADPDKSRVSNILLHRTTEEDTGRRFRRVCFWGSVLLKLSILAILLLLIGLLAYDIVPEAGAIYSASEFLYNLFYLILVGPTFLICLYYHFRGETTTIIPCVSSLWYKFYTIFIALSMLLYMIIAAVEVRKTYCGIYTTDPEWFHSDGYTCGLEKNFFTLPVPNRNSSGVLGTYSDFGFNLLEFSGTCYGSLASNVSWVNATCGLASHSLNVYNS